MVIDLGMEMIDVYDENRQVLRSQERGGPLNPGERLMAVGIWVFNSDGKLLVTRRSPEKSYAPGMWENPAGHVRAGETPADAVVRELYEETGVSVQPHEVVFLGESRSERYFGNDFGVRKDFPIERVRLQPGETCDAKWVTLQEFDEMIARGAFPKSLTDHLMCYKEAFGCFIKNGQ